MKIAPLMLSAALVLTGTAAYAVLAPGDIVGTSEADIRTSLEAKGYTIESIEIEKDEIEVEALLEGQEVEIELSVANGEVIEIELEDDEDDEDVDDDDTEMKNEASATN